MIKKVIVGLVVLVALLGIGFASYSYTKNNSTNNSTVKSVNQNTTNNITNNSTSSIENKISKAEAKKIANTYINSQGATAGTPNLIKQDGKYVYIVPVMDNGQSVGEIDIDAETGANLGGAGGTQ